MLIDLLHSSYFSLFLIVALGFMLGRIKIKGLSLDVSAVIFIALLFGHFGVIIPKELGNFGLVLFIFTIGIQAGPGFFDSFRSKGKTLILITMLIICSACLTAVGLKYAFDIDTPSYNPQIQISVVSGTKRSIFRQKNKTKRSKKRLHTTLIKPEQKVNEDLCSGFIVS